MAKTVYVDGGSGDNGNDGLTLGSAKATIAGARSVTAQGDLVLVSPGVYQEPDLSWGATNDYYVTYMPNIAQGGLVIVDFMNVEATYHWYMDFSAQPSWAVTTFVGIIFRNPGVGSSAIIGVRTTTTPTFLHCVFHNQFGTQKGRWQTPSGTASGRANLRNCTFYNLAQSIDHPQGGYAYNNYVVNCAGAKSGAGDYNAFPGNTEINGINTSTGANPGLRDASGGDFRLDPTTTPADYATFMTGGLFGDRIGAMGRGGYYYNPNHPPLRYISAAPTVAQGNPQPSWENDASYATGTPASVIEDPSTFEMKLDLASTPGATGGRVISDVIDISVGANLLTSIALSVGEFPTEGAIIDTDTSLPKKVEYRSQNGSFLKTDGTPTWTEFESGAFLNVSGHTHAQVRVTFQTAHTNA